MSKLATLILLILVCGIHAQGALSNEFCDLKENSTPEIRMSFSKSNITRQTNDIIRRSQSINWGASERSQLIYYERNMTLFVDQVKSNLTIIQYNSTNGSLLNYIDSRDQYILAREILEQGNKINYNVFEIQSGTSQTLKKLTIDGSTDSDGKTQIKFAHLSRIIQIQDNLMYVLLQIPQIFQKKPKSLVYTINLLAEEPMKFYAAVTEQFSVNIAGGNKHALFDSSCGQFYIYDSTSKKYTAKTLEQLNIAQYVQSSLNFVELTEGVLLGHSSSNSSANIFVLAQKQGTFSFPTEPTTIQGKIVVFTDHYRNAIFKTQSDFVWFKYEEGSTVTFQLSASSLDNDTKTKLSNIFRNAYTISFEFSKAVIIYREPMDLSFDSLAVLDFDKTSNKVTIQDRYFKIRENKQYLNQFPPTEIWTNENDFTCNCVSDVVQRIQCSGTQFQCVATTFPKKQVCTKPKTSPQL